MRKLLNNPWFVTAMALLAVALAWSSLTPSDPSAAGQADPDQIATADPAADQPLPGGGTTNASAVEALKQLTLPKTQRDPFATRGPQTTAAAEAIELPDLMDSAHLTGIWTQNGATLLLLNNRIFQVGESLGRLTIESATQDGVWLSHWKGRDFLTIGNSFTLKTPASRDSSP